MKERRNIERRKYGRKVTYPFIDSDGVLVTKNRRRLVDRRLAASDSGSKGSRQSQGQEKDASGMQSLDITDSKVMELEDALKDEPASKIEEAIKEIESQIVEQTTSFESAAKARREIISKTKKPKTETELAVPDIDIDESPDDEELAGTSLEVSYRGNRQVFTEDQNEYQVGRDPTCDVVVQGKFVSRAHAKIIFKDGKILLEDNSFNGTYIKFDNGQKIHISKNEQTLITDGIMSMGEPVKDNSKYNIEFRILS